MTFKNVKSRYEYDKLKAEIKARHEARKRGYRSKLSWAFLPLWERLKAWKWASK